MGSHLNFKNFASIPTEGSGGGRPPGNFPLARQSSVYSLTFDEFQNTMGGVGKDFGSMNMDELLKSIWSAEEIQSIGPAGVTAQDVGGFSGYLQRQGSLTLPRTLSQKTVDEVWRDVSKELTFGGKDCSADAYSNVPQRQPTLGEITLEEFLVRAGVVREEAQVVGKPDTNGIFDDFTANNQALAFEYQQPGRNTGLMGGRILDSSNQIGIESANLPLNVNGVRSTQQQLGAQQINQPQQLPQQQRQPLFPKQPVLTYGAPPVGIPNGAQLSNPGIRGGIVGDHQTGGTLVQNGALQVAGMGMVGMGAGGVTVAAVSPAVSSDGLGKSNGDTSSVSPIPYVFNNGGLRGRKCGALEKVVERRQRRMIKNRESAARSRARKQAYTTELEVEVAKLKEENQELQKKQADLMEMQKNQVMEMMNLHRGAKKRCLRRTQTGPW